MKQYFLSGKDYFSSVRSVIAADTVTLDDLMLLQ